MGAEEKRGVPRGESFGCFLREVSLECLVNGGETYLSHGGSRGLMGCQNTDTLCTVLYCRAEAMVALHNKQASFLLHQPHFRLTPAEQNIRISFTKTLLGLLYAGS